jgi:hypothetical protein
VDFAFLIDVEATGAKVRWEDDAPKSPELIAAACQAGFIEWEARESPLGILEEEFSVSPDLSFKPGARVLVGMNGSTLIELL